MTQRNLLYFMVFAMIPVTLVSQAMVNEIRRTDLLSLQAQVTALQARVDILESQP